MSEKVIIIEYDTVVKLILGSRQRFLIIMIVFAVLECVVYTLDDVKDGIKGKLMSKFSSVSIVWPSINRF